MKTINLKIEYSCITHEGKNALIVSEMKIPIEHIDDPVYWLDDQDKSEWMDENDILTILDYWIFQESEELPFKEFCKQIFEQNNATPELVLDFLACYSKMQSSLINLSNIQKFKIVMRGLDLAILSKLSAYESITKILKEGDKDYKIDNKRKLLD